MKSLCFDKKKVSLALLLSFGLVPGLFGQTLTISPAIVTNDYAGKIVLGISGLTTGKQVLVEKYADLNNNGTLEPGTDWLVQSFRVTDGSVSSIGGVRNINVPGDDDGLTNGTISVGLEYPGLNGTLARIAGRYLYRVSDPLGGFAVTNSLTIVQKPSSQGVTGTAYGADGSRLSNAVVVLIVQQGNGGIGTFTDANGNFALSNSPGSLALLAFKNGFVADESNAGITLTSNSFQLRNITNLTATTTLSGHIRDSGTAAALPGIFLQAESTDNLTMISFSDSNGGYSIPVTADQWKIKVNSDSGLAFAGYAEVMTRITTNTLSGSVSNLDFQNPKATALIYGKVTDTFSNVVSGLTIGATDASYTYENGGVSTTNGSYATAVFAGDWQVGPMSDELATRGLLGQNVAVTVTNGQAVSQNLQVRSATAHIRGRVIDSTGAPVDNMTIVVGLITNSGPFLYQVNPQTLQDGTFDVGVFAGQWSMALECNSASQRALVSPNFVLNVTNGVDITNITLVAQVATSFIYGTIKDNNNNPVSATVYTSTWLNGTNYNACGGNESTSFQVAVFSAPWQVGISGDLTSRGYDNPQPQVVNVTGTNATANITLYPAGLTPPRLIANNYANGQFQLTLLGDPGQFYRIEMSTNIGNPGTWVPLKTNQAFGGTFSFADTNAISGKPRFYRAKLVP